MAFWPKGELLMTDDGRRTTGVGILVAALCALTACENSGEDRVLAITSTGVVQGFVYFDANGDREPQPSDSPVPNIRVTLVARGSIETVADAVSDVNGLFEMRGVPVGDYELVVDSSTVADSVQVVRIDTSAIRLLPDDSSASAVAISYAKTTTTGARGLPQGDRVFVEGIALNNLALGTAGVFGDTTVHLADTAGAIRGTRIRRTTVIVGDSVRFLGTLATRDGQPVLTDVDNIFLAPATEPPAEVITTAVADTADGGRLDAALVQVDSATISDTSTVSGDVLLTVDDGSGSLDVLLDNDTGIDQSPFVPAVVLDIKGLLVPVGDGTWTLKPRSNADLTFLVLTVTVSQAKFVAPLGERVNIVGAALNRWETFGDSTVHMIDATGSIRATSVDSVDYMVGDTVRMTGVTALRDGQRVLNNVTVVQLAGGVAPTPSGATTGVASTASGGFLDAALVSVTSATISDTATSAAGFELTVSDGTGNLTVLLDQAISFGAALVMQLVPGANVDVDGVLVPDPLMLGRWVLKPRGDGDIVVN